MSNDAILGAVAALAVFNLAVLAWVAVLQGRLKKRDRQVDKAGQDVAALQQSAENIMLARLLIRTEDSVNTDLQTYMSQRTQQYANDMQATFTRIVQDSENAMKQMLDQQLQAIDAIRSGTLQQMEASSQEQLQLLATLREASQEQVSTGTQELLQTLTDLRTSSQAQIQTGTQQLVQTLSEVRIGAQQQIQGGIAEQMQALNDLRASTMQQMQESSTQLADEYRDTLAKLHEAAVVPMGEINELMATQKAQIQVELHDESERERSAMAARLDAKLADLISSYLTEALGNDVDLGAQGAYLFRMLDEHKEELKQEILSGT